MDINDKMSFVSAVRKPGISEGPLEDRPPAGQAGLLAELRSVMNGATRMFGVAAVLSGVLLTVPNQAAAQAREQVGIEPAVQAAISRDLGITPEQATERAVAERAAQDRRAKLQVPESSFAGSWFDPITLELVVAVTDSREAVSIGAEGVRVIVVERSAQQLNSALQRLNESAGLLTQDQQRSIWAWRVDVKSNAVTITIPADDVGARGIAQNFVALSGADINSIRIEESTQGPPALFQPYNLRGGDGYINTTISGTCSVGFAVRGGGYVTAGHCSGGATGHNVNGYNGVSQGTFQQSLFPTADSAYVSSGGFWTPRPCVGTGSNWDCSANVPILGSTEAGVGTTVCRYGQTTGGPHCGQIQAQNVTVNFGGQVVQNLTETTACAQPGDSGGPFVWNNQGQGTVTGGSGNCSVGGTTYFYPLNRTLNHFGLQVLTQGVDEYLSLTVGQCGNFHPMMQAGVRGFSTTAWCGAPIGSIAPATLSGGKSIVELSVWINVVSSFTRLSISGFSSDPGKLWLNHVSVDGTPPMGNTRVSGAASYSYSGGTATWQWANAPWFHPSHGPTVVVEISHQ